LLLFRRVNEEGKVKAAVRPRVVVLVIVFSLLGVRAVQYVQRAGAIPGNFVAFYVAGRAAAEGRADQLYDIPVEVRTIKGLGIGPEHYHLWMHPAFEALALEWLAPFSYESAARAWAVLMVLLVGVDLWLLRDTSSIGFIVMGTLLWATPGVLDQDIALLILVLVGSFLAFRRGKDVTGGVLLALGLFRFHQLWILPAVLLLKRRRRALGSFSAVAAGLGAISLAMVGPSIFHGYFHTLSVTAHNDNYVLSMMPTVHGYGGTFLPHWPWMVPVLSCLVAAPVVIAWMWQPWDGTGPWEMMFALTVVAGLAISLHSFFYDMAVLVFPISVLGKRAISRPACELLALIPFVPALCCEAAVFPVLAAEVALILALWLRSRDAPQGDSPKGKSAPPRTLPTAEQLSPSPDR
jgi:hypothetical protein